MTNIVKERDEGKNSNHASRPILILCTLLLPLIGLTGLIAMLFLENV